MAQMRTSSPDESQLMFLPFDPLHQDGADLRGLPLSERKRDLDRLCRKSKVPYLSKVETFADRAVLFDYCNKFGFEGVVSKLRNSGYICGLSGHWVKTKCPDWKRDNAERWRIFNQPDQTEGQRALARKREELARVLAPADTGTAPGHGDREREIAESGARRPGDARRSLPNAIKQRR